MIDLEPEEMMFSVGIYGRETRVIVDGARLLCEAAIRAGGGDSAESMAEILREISTIEPPEDAVADSELAAVGWRVINRMNDLGNAPGPRPSSPRPMDSPIACQD